MLGCLILFYRFSIEFLSHIFWHKTQLITLLLAVLKVSKKNSDKIGINIANQFFNFISSFLPKIMGIHSLFNKMEWWLVIPMFKVDLKILTLKFPQFRHHSRKLHPNQMMPPFPIRFFELLNCGVQSFARSLFCSGNSESGTFLGGSYFSQVSGMVSWFFWSWASKIWWRLNWIKRVFFSSLCQK